MQEKQTPSGNRGEQRPLEQQAHVFCILFALTYTLYFSLSIIVHLGLEKDSKLIFLGLECVETSVFS